MTTDETEAFLAEPGHLARIATVDDDGFPRVLPLWFVVEGGRLYFTPRSPAVIWRNIVRDARVGISVDEAVRPYRKVTIQGVATVVHPPGADDEWRDRYRRIARRYTPEEWADHYVDGTSDQPRALCAVELGGLDTRMTTWRMPVRGENPTGIWHRRYYGEGTAWAALAE